MTCIFCDIVAGYKPAKKIYEDDKYVAFLDVKPVAPGHTLLIPKKHHARITEDMNTPEMWEITRKLTRKMEETLRVQGTTIAIQNGRDAGQLIDHVHVHIIPRVKGDGGTIANIFTKAPPMPAEQMEQIQNMLSV